MQIRANPYLKKINLRERRFKRQETRFNCSFFGQFPCSWIRIRFPSLRIRIQDSKISADLCESIPVFDIKKPSRTKVQKASTTLFFFILFSLCTGTRRMAALEQKQPGLEPQAALPEEGGWEQMGGRRQGAPGVRADGQQQLRKLRQLRLLQQLLRLWSRPPGQSDAGK
jgi:hypothetical protein